MIAEEILEQVLVQACCSDRQSIPCSYIYYMRADPSGSRVRRSTVNPGTRDIGIGMILRDK